MKVGRRIAVVLFNLGGPDDQASVKPFLFNLFNDPAIIGLPGFCGPGWRADLEPSRNVSAQANYALMGGGSPLLPETRRQASALEAVLAARPCPATRSRPSSPCATGAPDGGDRHRRRRLRAGRGRAAAALSAVLDHHDAVVR
jgi:hypothetical protein